ncbi:hypothetical protein [Bernardetia sp.]|uniref:hypothetical protein n=1 Tax=Bernardetia sp. TaxID=1937974 RepID=UPI0025C2FF79|nr:hypothetical protein [Bernardetia sp.]
MKTKLSAFTGISLLILIIGFTIFVNLPKQEKDKEYKDFTKEELEDLWELEGMETQIKNSVIKISKVVKDTSKIDSVDAEANWNYTFLDDDIIYYHGHLELFDSDEDINHEILGFNVGVRDNKSDSIFLSKIGHLFVKYQIRAIHSETNNWKYTTIHLRDGRQLFLIKKETEVIDNYYKVLIENAEIINDSTKIIFPVAARKIQGRHYEDVFKKKEEKQRINLFEDGIF